MTDPFAGRRYQGRTGQGMYEGANDAALSGVKDYFARRNQEAAAARGRVADAYESGGLGRAVGRTAREVYDNAAGKAGAVRDAAVGLRGALSGVAKQALVGATGEEVRPQAPTPTLAAAAPVQTVAASPSATLNDEQRAAAGDAYRDAWQRQSRGGLRNASSDALALYNAEQQVRDTGVSARRGANGVMEFSGTNVTRGPAGAFAKGVDLRAGNEAMARANAIRQEYLDSQAGNDAGPRGGSIGGAGLRFNRRSDERAADRAHRQAMDQAQLQLDREKFEFDKTPKPMSELEQEQLAAARQGLRQGAANHTRTLLGDAGYDDNTQRRILQNVGPALVEADPAQQLPLIADEARNIKLSDAVNQYSLNGTSEGHFIPAKEDAYDWGDWRLWDDDPNTPNFWQTVTSDKGDVVVGTDGRRVNAKRLRGGTKDLDLLNGLNGLNGLKGLRHQP